MAEPRKTRRPDQRGWLLLAAALAILILGDLNRRMTDARRLERDSIQLATQVVELERTNAALQTRVAMATSDPAVEDWARSEGRMVLPGERLIMPVPAEPVAGRVPVDTAEPVEPPTNWEVWLALLFGG
jgi:cell division protein FtsB